MRKLFAIAIFSVLTLSACGGGASKSDEITDDSAAAPVDKNANLVGFVVDLSCATAQYDGDVPEDKMSVISDKYGIADAELETILKGLPASDVASVKEQAVPKIKAQCSDAFAKGGVEPETFVDILFE